MELIQAGFCVVYTPRGVTRALMGVRGGGGSGVCSHIRVLPDEFLLKLSSFRKKLFGQNTNI